MSELLTPSELGEIYKVSSKTISRWYQSGIIPAEVAQGQIIRFDREAVADALKQAAVKAKKIRKRVALT
jgi:predicted site-specific integrase-resolvase